eukprot:GEMP01019740.1.p1 GENE.GEMP01019740.1~~GEMP01019740.1.p1  ORF type:complete len:551 (-),score=106.78 GEMP01019740.1:820-2472(-)
MEAAERRLPLLGFLQSPHLSSIIRRANGSAYLQLQQENAVMSDDPMRSILSFAIVQLTDVLRFALVNQQLRRLVLEYLHINESPKRLAKALQNAHVAQQFIQMSQFIVVSRESDWKLLYAPIFGGTQKESLVDSSDDGMESEDVGVATTNMLFGDASDIGEISIATSWSSSRGSRHSPCLHCAECMTPLLLQSDVVSTNYRISTGRAYLCSMARNVSISTLITHATYTTGVYKVAQVECAICSASLGVKYVGTLDPTNNYKIGKYLMGQSQIIVPKCCKGLMPNFPNGACWQCKATCCSHTLRVVLHITKRLQPYLCRQLLDAVQAPLQADADASSGLLSVIEPQAKFPRLLRQCCRSLLPMALTFRGSPASFWRESLLKRITLPYIGPLTHHDRQMMSASLVMFAQSFALAAEMHATCLGFDSRTTQLTRAAILGKMVPSLLGPQQSGEWLETARLVSVAQTSLWEKFTQAELRSLLSSLEPYAPIRGQLGLEAVLWHGDVPLQEPLVRSHVRRSIIALKGYLRNMMPNPLLRLQPIIYAGERTLGLNQ